jgi:hypothetical protein
VIPADFHEFFAAMTGASASLIGLLFVVISVAPQRFTDAKTRSQSHSMAGFALIAFTNVLVFCTVALIPGVDAGWVAIVIGTGGLFFTVASGRVMLDARRHGHAERGWIWTLVSMATVFGWELVEGVLLVGAGRDTGAVTTIAALLVGSLLGGVDRAWRLVGMRNTGMVDSVTTLLRGSEEGNE